MLLLCVTSSLSSASIRRQMPQRDEEFQQVCVVLKDTDLPKESFWLPNLGVSEVSVQPSHPHCHSVAN